MSHTTPYVASLAELVGLRGGTSEKDARGDVSIHGLQMLILIQYARLGFLLKCFRGAVALDKLKVTSDGRSDRGKTPLASALRCSLALCRGQRNCRASEPALNSGL